MVDARQGLRRGVCRGIDGHAGAQAAETPRCLGGNLLERLQATSTSVAEDEIACPQEGDHRRGLPLIGRPSIGHGEGMEVVREQRIDASDLHRRAAGTPPGPLKRLGSFCVEPTWRTVCEEDASTGRQSGGRQRGIEGRELFAQRQLQDLLQRGHGFGGCRRCGKA